MRGGTGAEVIYALRNTSTLANKILDSFKAAGHTTRKAYQRRLPSNTSKDYYFIHRNTGVTEPVLVEYGFIDDTPANFNYLQNNYKTLAEAVIKAVADYAKIPYTPPEGATSNIYTVERGDSLYSIAKKFNTTVDTLKKLNNLTSNTLQIGQYLKLPSSETPSLEYIVQRGDTLYSIATKYNTTVNELKRFRNSKYVQSDLGDSFCLVKDFLQKDRWVCFSGTPCQTEGLSKFLRKPYEKLILVDVVCHGIPSPLIWSKYLECQKQTFPKPDNIRFRDKFYGYKYSTMSIIQDGKNVYHAGSQLDPMLRAFFSDTCDRPSCYECPFKKRYRVSDFTIWDCFSVYDFDKKLDDDKGTTRVLCHSQKAANLMREVMWYARCEEVSADKLVVGVKEMFESVPMNPKRTVFLADAAKMSGKELFKKYYPVTNKVKVKTAIRKALLMTGIYGIMKKCLNRVRGR